MINGGIGMHLPEDLLYSEEDEWIKQEDDKVRIGITSFAQDELGAIVFVELPEGGDALEKDEPFGSSECVNTVSELSSPLSSEVIEVNDELEDSPEYVNESPYEKAWMIVVKLSDDGQLEELLSADKYQEVIDED